MPTRRRILGHWPLTAPSAVHLTTCFSPDSQHCGLSVEALLPLSPLQRFNLFNYGCSITPRDWNVKKIFDGRFVPPLRWAGGALADRNGVFLTQSHSRTLYIFMDSTADSEPWTVFLATERTAAGGGMWG